MSRSRVVQLVQDTHKDPGQVLQFSGSRVGCMIRCEEPAPQNYSAGAEYHRYNSIGVHISLRPAAWHDIFWAPDLDAG
jgi:hypothetical protein